MSDAVKDFAYYAAKAEDALRSSLQAEGTPGQRDRYIQRADVYARLACGTPKTTRDEHTACSKAHPQYDTLHPGGYEVRTESRCFSGKSGEPGSPHSHFCVHAIFHSDEHMCECGTGWF